MRRGLGRGALLIGLVALTGCATVEPPHPRPAEVRKIVNPEYPESARVDGFYGVIRMWTC